MKKIGIILLIVVSAAAFSSLCLYKSRWAQNADSGTRSTVRLQGETKPQPTNAATDALAAKQSLESLMARLEATKAGIERQADKQGANEGSGGAKEATKKESTVAQDLQMSAPDFLAAFGDAIARGDFATINALMQKVPRSAECVEPLKTLVTETGNSKDLRRYAAEALVRIGTQESVGFVLDQARAAQAAGDFSLASTLLYSLEAPTTVEGAQALFDLLLGTGRYAGNRATLPEEFRSAARKALRNAPDREGIGNLAARLYLDPEISGRNEALVELFGGVSHPNMLSSLAVQAYQAGAPENATQFLNQLGQVSEQGTVQAMVEVASREPALLNDAAERLYGWSLRHPQQAAPGLFMEYLTDATRKPSERIIAAFGLAGIEDTQFTARAFEKALNQETDPGVRAGLVALQGFLAAGQKHK